MAEKDINMALPEKSIQPELKRPAKPKLLKLVKQPPERNNMSKEAEDLATHVEICAIRYQVINDKFDIVDSRLANIDSNLLDIKNMIVSQQSSKFKTMLTVGGSIMVSLVGLLGYMIVNLK